ncbi:PLP-dependent aminotransferase family protein [Psychromonas sp. RZ22]|uniref:MocR-like pyridoxine biosynthesis transcription factor PdxR n=1 Tax=Psychromonas algarum TaxID=2555643 RepID=UPI001067758B|nr:PLP-dependent aminotransferase family protein [Psychromonas sp. RZ22]TEW54651.1 PLP-dependent aminotransferase family protein [Psychromonas sp. RZ22]
MVDFLINIELHNGSTYQQQIREKLVELIESDTFGDKALPSGRKMAQLLKVSRNTVVLVYESLVDDGYLVARKRSGFFVHPDLAMVQRLPSLVHSESLNQSAIDSEPDWSTRLQKQPSQFSSLNKDEHWLKYPYPFIYGHIDVNEFPLYQWRECSRIAESKGKVHEWVEGFIGIDDPQLISQIRQQILSKRGISAQDEEVLITLGTQNSLFLLTSLLAAPSVTFGVEDPGYANLRHVISLCESPIKPLEVDKMGVKVGEQLTGCDYVCVTPSHQYPTTVTMTIERRKALLEQASRDDFIVIEDDYESEVNFIEEPLPALKSFDKNSRVIYVGSLSKSLTPGIRIGYLVANKALIKELRTLRSLHYRHPPSNNQRIAALFISQGYYDSHVRRMRRTYEHKWLQMQEGIERYLPGCEVHSTAGSFCFWIGLPKGITSQALREEAAQHGILIESGDTLFMQEDAPKNYIRLGFSAIQSDKILAGLAILGGLIAQLDQSSSYYIEPFEQKVS